MKTDYTGMIPPAEVRQIRRCKYCAFSWEDDYLDLNCNLNVYTRTDITRDETPCVYHYTPEEMAELIDNLEK